MLMILKLLPLEATLCAYAKKIATSGLEILDRELDHMLHFLCFKKNIFGCRFFKKQKITMEIRNDWNVTKTKNSVYFYVIGE